MTNSQESKGGNFLSKVESNSLNEYRKKDLALRVASQCAPLLCGIKISNILIIQNDEIKRMYQLFCNTSINMKRLYVNDHITSFLLYDHDKLEMYLQNHYIHYFMNQQGYKNLEIHEILDQVSNRYREFKNNTGEFPHELGILLGYPLSDVIGFIENKGQNSLYTGYWKVYSNVSQALMTFLEYTKAKEIVERELNRGLSISEIMNTIRFNRNLKGEYKKAIAV